ncbi:MAG: signal recognition particle receptor subunit alpha [Nanoarchaeota archaeon]
MVLDKLGDSLKGTLQKIAKSLFVDEKLINEVVKDIQRALLQGDVNVKLVLKLTKAIKERAMKEETKGLSKKEQMVNIVYEELTNFLGGEIYRPELIQKPTYIMMVGLFGNGKTTTTAKLGKFFAKRGNKVALLGLDVHRPAAMKQIEQLGKQINIPSFTGTGKDALKIFKEHEKALKSYDVVLVDTAGRDALSDDLIEEINQIAKAVSPQEVFLVIGADVGQTAEKQAQAFHDSCGVSGVIITKMDGTGKGGGALAACAVTNAPVAFIGTGEKVDDLEEFKPANFVSRLLGMGDIETLLEKAKDVIDQDKAEDLGKRFLKGDFNLIDLYEQMEAMQKMGPLGKVMEMIPGFGQLKIPKDMLKGQEGKLKKWRIAMDSMTKNELEDPDTISRTRIERIARGSGCSIADIRELLKQYKQSKKMMKMMKGEKGMEKMMKRMQSSQMKMK